MARTVMKIEGFRELENALKKLPDQVGLEVARKSVADAGEEMADEQRRRVPVDEGDLRDSIVSTVSARNLDGLAEYGAVMRAGGTRDQASAALVQARSDAKATGSHKGHRISARVGPSKPHGQLVEYGTGPRWRKNGQYAGVMPAQPFARPAFDSKVNKSIEIIKDGLTVEIRRAASEMSKQSNKGGR